MGSLAAFNTAYVNSNVVPTGTRLQLAGLTYSLGQQYAKGAVGAAALNGVAAKRANRIIYRAERESNPNQPALASDFLAIDAP